MIKAPDIFRHFARGFLDELYEDGQTAEEFYAVQSRWGSSGIEAENIVLRDFLTQLIEGPYSDDELVAVWDAVHLDFSLTADELRRYLPVMRDNVGLLPPVPEPRG